MSEKLSKGKDQNLKIQNISLSTLKENGNTLSNAL